MIAAIARILQRPVKNVVTRDQGFTLNIYRAETRHRVRLGTGRDGHLIAFEHKGEEISSRYDAYMVAGVASSSEMYAGRAVSTGVSIVHADRNSPGFMRSPAEFPYIFALESAIDELACVLKMDPVELRRINDTMVGPGSIGRYTSRSLMQCFDQAAASFGWKKRNPEPMSMRDGDWLIGWGTALATYPTQMMAATARVRMERSGRTRVEIAAHDVGQGAYSAICAIAAEALGISPELVTVELGDTRLPPGPLAGGSMTTASAGSAVMLACAKIKARFGDRMPATAELVQAFSRLGVTSIEDYAEWSPPGSGPDAVHAPYQGMMGSAGEGEAKGHDSHANQNESKPAPRPLMYAFGAEFVEVRIHRLTREIRVPRMTGAFAGGRIVNPRTARSQYLGGMIWGMSSALLEATEIDRRRARYVNDNIADYLIATNADIPKVDIILVPEVDNQVNPIGVKGIGEVANVGTAAAIANAVYHATGKRIRDLPITIDKLI